MSIAAKVTEFARAHLRHRVGSGECYDLADHALKKAGAKSANAYGEITDDADYVWGKEIPVATAQAGDILQFRNHSITVTTETVTRDTASNGAWTERDHTTKQPYSRGHHTAIVKRNLGGGRLQIYEQHVKPLGSVVQEHTLWTASSVQPPQQKRVVKHTAKGPVTETTTVTVTVEVSGTIWAYRPEPK